MKNIFKLTLLALCIMPSVIFGGKAKKRLEREQREKERQENLNTHGFKVLCPKCRRETMVMINEDCPTTYVECLKCWGVFNINEARILFK